MFGLFNRGINIESGIVHAPGYFCTGERPRIGKPLAELYALSAADEPVVDWWLCEQERLSRPVRWGDDYFQLWAEILAFGVDDGSIDLRPCWVMVGFDASGRAVSAVDYFPTYNRKGQLQDIGYRDASAERLRRA